MTDEKVSVVTCTAPVNIAVIKYWGKRDEELILPINGSVSVTLDQQQLCAKTSVAISKSFTDDRMWLNGKEEPINSPRTQNVLKEIRRRARKRRSGDQEDISTLTSHVHICSENNFPTAAGLASSAAGFSCLVFALAKLYGVSGDISEVARQGSGSACRSVYGGFVEWTQGDSQDGRDSIAHQVAPHTHWPDMHVLVLVVSSGRKLVGSSDAMRRSVATSQLLTHRAQCIVPHRITRIKTAINNRDFHTFAEITMQESNQFHATCLDTYPPVFYLTDTSRAIIQLIHAINAHHNTNKVAYTFDAGPNACLYLLEEDVPLILGIIQYFFPSSQDNGDSYVRGLQCQTHGPTQELLESLSNLSPHKPGSLQYIIHTKIGPGPQVLMEEECLLGDDGLPRETSH